METVMNLEWLVSPVGKQHFLDNYIEQKPLVIKREQRQYFNKLLSIEDINYLISQGQTLGSYNIRLANSGRVISNDEYSIIKKMHNVSLRTGIQVKKALEMFDQEKATIILEDLTAVWPQLKNLAKNVDADLSKCNSGANVYVTPRQAQGFNAHYDTHDVFILQVYGKKRWKIYNNPIVLPLGAQHSLYFDYKKLDLLYDIEVEEGDTVYMPKGFVHEAVTSEEISAHITLGLYTTTWARVLVDYFTALGFEYEHFRRDFTTEELKSAGNREDLFRLMKQRIVDDLTLEKLEALSGKYASNVGPLPAVESLSLGSR